MNGYRFINIGLEGIEGDFWMLNPQLKYLDPFKALYDKDASKHKVQSSKTMWCIWMLMDPSFENKIFQQEEESREKALSNYHPKFDRDEKLTRAVIDVYDSVCLTAVGRSYKSEVRTMEQRATIVSTTAYTFDRYEADSPGGRQRLVKGTSDSLDRMRLMTSKLMEGYDRVAKLFTQEQESARVTGGRNETMRELRRLKPVKEEYE